MTTNNNLVCTGRLKSQVALITGASSGIALAMADAGADVVINYISDEKSAHDLAGQRPDRRIVSEAY